MKLDIIVCDLFHIVGTLQGYACGLGYSHNPNLELLIEGLANCAETLEQVAAGIRLNLEDRKTNVVDH